MFAAALGAAFAMLSRVKDIPDPPQIERRLKIRLLLSSTVPPN